MAHYEQTVTDSLLSLVEGAQFTSQNTGNVADDYAATEWLSDVPMPSLADVEAEIAKIAAGNPTDASGRIKYEYRRLRAPEYPPVTDLADAIFWQQQGDNSKMEAYVAACEAVKAKYPKPE